MEIVLRESSMVRPMEETPKIKLWSSNLDVFVSDFHTQTVYFYRPNAAMNLVDTKVMKETLSKVLVDFYPVAGRFKEDQEYGSVQIDCQGQGVLFVEAESDGVIDDFGDFAPRLEFLKLIPPVDYSMGIESYPLVLLQVTHFKCGGVSLGVGWHHRVGDGLAAQQFFISWSEVARGFDVTLQPFLDRTLLRARDPPQPVFEHREFQPVKSMKSSSITSPLDEIVTSMFKLTQNQVNIIKTKWNENDNTVIYSSYEMLAGHIWRSVTKARGLVDGQDIELYVPMDGRTRLQPPLPLGYFGNAIFRVTPIAVAEKLQSNPVWYAANKIHDEIAQRNNDYLRSSIDYMELQPDLNAMLQFELKFPNLMINSWIRLPIHEVDFGWGRPIFMGPAYIPIDGMSFLLPSPINDGSIVIAISLQAKHMKHFSKFLYDI